MVNPMNVIEFISPSDENVVSIRHFAGGGMVVVEQNYDKHDFAGNEKIAKLLAYKKGDNVRVRAHINKDNVPNPELEINGRLADRKTPDYKKYKNVAIPIKNLTKKAQKQGAIHTVIELSCNYDLTSVAKGLTDAFRHSQKMQVIDIILQDESIVRIERLHYETNTICKVLSDDWLDAKK